MLTRIEIDGFKTFSNFSLDLRPFTAVVGPNASGKSNLFDALRFLSLLAQFDIRTAMQDLRGLPEELFRQTASGTSEHMTFAVEVLLEPNGKDSFGRYYEILAQRVRYELMLVLDRNSEGLPTSVYVGGESCTPLAKKEDRATYLKGLKIGYSNRKSPFINVNENHDAIEIRQDGFQKRGRPISIAINEASRTALSAVTTSAEFPHLYALREALSGLRFLEINPKAVRSTNDRFEDRVLKSDASNLAAVLAHLKVETATELRPEGVLSDIVADLSSLIPSVCRLDVNTESDQRQYSFSLGFVDSLNFSSRVISDGTLRLLALLTVLDDPRRRGTLCFEEPENGVHEGRVPMLVRILRHAAQVAPEEGRPFQILLNTHSPKVLAALQDSEIVAADSVTVIDSKNKSKANRTRMRTGVWSQEDLFDPEHHLTRSEVERLLQKANDAA